MAIVEDYSPLLHGLRLEVNHSTGLHCVGIFETSEEAISAFEKLRPDVVLVDLSLPRMDGFECTRRIKKRWPRMKVLIFTADESKAQEAFVAGASGYLDKRVPRAELADFIRRAYRGEEFMSDRAGQCVIRSWCLPPAASVLTRRESEVMDLFHLGVKETANRLGISPKTVEQYRKSARQKLGNLQFSNSFKKACV